jgi:hypothetical protein
MLYILKNEHTRRIKIVTVLDEWKKITRTFTQKINFLDEEFPEIDIEFIVLNWKFWPKLIQNLSREWKIPVNFMFIWSPSYNFPYKIEELGWVRLII